MKVVRILILVLLVPTLAFAQYKVVLKNGKVIEGKYLNEDATNIFIESNGVQMNFKKETLDLDKMKELNPQVSTPAKPPAPRAAAQPPVPKAVVKKPARVYTTEDLKQMKEIWDEGKSDSESTPASGPAVADPTEATQTAPINEAEAPQTSEAAEAAEAQMPSQPEPPAETPEPAGPRDERTIRDEISAVDAQIVETEKRIQDLKSKGRVTGTWDKLLVKQKKHLADLQQELKDVRKAAKAAAETQ
jgi:hypothetical protein